MVKQKVVMKVSMNDEKSRTRALKTVVGVPGCLSVSIEGKEKDLMVVIGEGIDSFVLVKSLRKKVGYAELITVSPAQENKKNWSSDERKQEKPTVIFQGPPTLQPVTYNNPEPCSIL